jgi:hypothetical protein
MASAGEPQQHGQTVQTAVTRQPAPPSSFDGPMPEYRLQPSTAGADLVIAGLLTLVHAFLASPFLVYLLVFVPRYRKILEDFQLKLPLATALFFDLADFLKNFWFFVPFLLIGLCAVDFGVLYLLRRRRPPRLLLWVYFVLGSLLLLGCFFLAQLAMQLPMIDLMDGLSK